MARVSLLFVGYFAISFFLSAGVNWVAAISWRKARSAHWTERARLLWPVRRGAGTTAWVLPFGFGFLQACSDGELSLESVAAAIAAWLGAVLGGYPLVKEILPRLLFRQWLRLAIFGWSSWIVSVVLWVGACLLMPLKLDWRCVAIVAGFIGLSFLKGFARRRALGLAGVALPGDDRIKDIISRTAVRMGLRLPRVWLLDVPMANAWALQLYNELMFTKRLMEICSDEEVEAICAHEFAHLAESKAAVITRVVGSFVYVPFLFLRPAIHAYGDGGLWLLLLAVALLYPLRTIVGRQMERRADKFALQQQSAAGVYARALEKLCQENQTPVASGGGGTHPDLYDRLVAAGVQPDYPRPKAPERWSAAHFAVWIGLVVLIAMMMAGSLPSLQDFLGQTPG